MTKPQAVGPKEDHELAILIATLLQTERRLDEVTGGQIDSVTDATGQSFLLRRTQEDALEVEAAKKVAILNSLPAKIALLDGRGVITAANTRWLEFTSTGSAAAPGHPIGVNYIDACERETRERDEPQQAVADAIRAVISGGAPTFSTDYMCRLPEGKRWFELTVTPLLGTTLKGAVVAHSDITEKKRSKERLKLVARRMAYSSEHDSLTGLPNRTKLVDRIDKAIEMARRRGEALAIMFLDLDGFKRVNDSLGHHVGDNVLKVTARRLAAAVRASDTVSRQGGDEFVVLLPSLERAQDATRIAAHILATVAKVQVVEGTELHITASLGVSIYPDDGLDTEILLRHADIAMYDAKLNGRQRYRFFNPSMNLRAHERQSVESGLRGALIRNEFVLYLQPKVDIASGTIRGAEALLRWIHPTRGLVGPADFIPIAEECGLMPAIGRWVFREACRQVRSLQSAGAGLMSLAVNISTLEFAEDGFLAELLAIIDETEVDPSCLEIEITESALIKNVQSTADVLKILREKNIKVSIDDFGTGYSSLSYLSKFPVDILKIDRIFVADIGVTTGGSALVAAIIAMAHALGLRVVAEGVETSEQLAYLRSHDCDEAQGYYYSPPVPLEYFLAFILAENLRGQKFSADRAA